jgi:hypothetical protein
MLIGSSCSPFGLRAYDPVEDEPEDGFCVMIKFMPPMGINTVRRNEDNIARLIREFIDAIRVVGLITLRTYRYFGDIKEIAVGWHSPSQFNSASNENRCALMTSNVSDL